MIHALLEYARDRGLVSRPGYAKKRIRWILDFDAQGSRFTGLVPSDREFPEAPDLSQPEKKTLGAQRGASADFLLAPLGTLLGWGKDKDSETTEHRRRDTLVWMFHEASRRDPALGSLAEALVDDAISAAMRKAVGSIKPVAVPTHRATVRIGGRFPVEEDSWHEWWDQFRATLKKSTGKHGQMVDFGDGHLTTPERTHPKLKNLKGVGLSQAHAPIITFDKEAFGSYGLSQGENAAMGAGTANAYASAIDHLLESSVVYAWRRSKRMTSLELQRGAARIAGARLAYWYMGPAEARKEVEDRDDLIAMLLGSENKEEPPQNPEDGRVLAEARLRRTLDRLRSGGAAQPVGAVRFCVLALSGAGARVMVRDFVEGTVLGLAEKVKQWFADLDMVTYEGLRGYGPGLEQVATAPLPHRRQDQDYLKWVAPCGTWRQALWRAALTGGRIPGTAFARALSAHNGAVVRGELTAPEKKDATAARRSSRLRLALVKAYLVRSRKGGPKMESALDPEHPSAAYHCGRLLAAYDSLQRAALGDVGAGVVQRYYGGALTNPAGVFGQLSRMAQMHLSKLDGGLAHVYAERIGQIHNGLRRDGDQAARYPAALDMEGQALFALGFWHQTAAINKERSEAAAAKKAKKAREGGESS